MAAAAQQTQAAPRTFNFAPKFGVTVPPEAPTAGPGRANPIVDDFLVPSMKKIMSDETGKETAEAFFPLAYFQEQSNDWAKSNGKTPKVLKLGDARQKLNDIFAKFKEKHATAGVLEQLIYYRTGKEGIDGITEPGLSVFVRIAPKK